MFNLLFINILLENDVSTFFNSNRVCISMCLKVIPLHIYSYYKNINELFVYLEAVKVKGVGGCKQSVG